MSRRGCGRPWQIVARRPHGRSLRFSPIVADQLSFVFAQLANRAGVPPGVINVVTTQANVNEVGREMCEHTAVKKVSFTGSTPVAKILYGLASSTLKKVSIEAGGNAPFIVFDDADIDAAVEGESGLPCLSHSPWIS